MIYHQRQKYIDLPELTPQAVAHCNILQPKWDGIWGRMEIGADRSYQIFSRNGALKAESHKGAVVDPVITLIGEFMYGSEWAQDEKRKGNFYAFDCLLMHEQSLLDRDYAERLTKAKAYITMSSHPFKFLKSVISHPADHAKKAWKFYVEEHGYEGLVFRHTSDKWTDPVYRIKQSIEVDLVVTDVVQGSGKYSDCMGALLCKDTEWREHLVGGGFTDAQRREWWTHPSKILGKTITVECKKVFDSGKLRHPNFKRIHLDK